MNTPSSPNLLSSSAFRVALSVLAAAMLASCGGGGSSSSGSSSLPSSSSLAEQCAAPRPTAAMDPITGNLYGDTQGSLDTEKAFLRSWIDETYLWYQDVRALPTTTLDATRYATPIDYFNVLKTPLNDAAGQAKDKFHFTYDTVAWDNLSLSGIAYGYDFEVALVSSTPPRSAIVAYTDDGAATGDGGVGRGAVIVTVDGVDLANGSDTATLNAGLFPTAAGPHTLVVRDPGQTATRTVSLNARAITETPVQNVKTLPVPNQKVGYMLFNDHIATSEPALVNAVTSLKNKGITDLVLDIRYNGGGYLDIASELAYMIAGPNVTTSANPPAFFEREMYNDRNPFNLTPAQATTPFHATTQGFSGTSGIALPVLGLSRVYVLTTADTCSASEAIINGLRGVGVAVNLVGGTTCGKPYGFFPKDNCSTTYFAIQFQGVNNLNFGDYPDGFAPTCAVADDFTHALGDPAEAQLNLALGLRASGTCTPAMGAGTHILVVTPAEAPRTSPVLVRNPFRENRIFRLQ
ncbi:MAG: S41 family peptidase [Pseudomonadota bacterium]|nr:S41 family peptidase [Pseudomonadota bacterium]